MPSFLPKPPSPVLQRSDPLARGLVAAWPFFEGAGQILSDLSGSGNNLTTNLGAGSVSWQAGPLGSQLAPIQPARLVPAKVISFSSTAKFTIALTFVPHSQTDSYGNLGTTLGGNGPGIWYRGSGAGADAGKMDWYDIGDNLSTTTAVDNQVNTFVIAHTGTTIAFFLNGQASGTSSPNNNALSFATIGDDTGFGHTATVAICDYRVYSGVAFTLADAKAYHQDPFRLYRPRSRLWEYAVSAPVVAAIPRIFVDA